MHLITWRYYSLCHPIGKISRNSKETFTKWILAAPYNMKHWFFFSPLNFLNYNLPYHWSWNEDYVRFDTLKSCLVFIPVGGAASMMRFPETQQECLKASSRHTPLAGTELHAFPWILHDWLIFGMCSVAKSYLTLCDPMDCSSPRSSTMVFPTQEYWNELPFHPSGDLSDPGIEPASTELAGGFFTTTPPWWLSTFNKAVSLCQLPPASSNYIQVTL